MSPRHNLIFRHILKYLIISLKELALPILFLLLLLAVSVTHPSQDFRLHRPFIWAITAIFMFTLFQLCSLPGLIQLFSTTQELHQSLNICNFLPVTAVRFSIVLPNESCFFLASQPFLLASAECSCILAYFQLQHGIRCPESAFG